MNIWGVTGTNGKTTTTWIFAAFLNGAPPRKCGYVTTVEVFDGVRHFSTGYTTPPLAQLREIFAAMEKNGCTDCVMEVSSHAIHQNRTGETVFAGGAFTNISEDHLDYHKTMADYFRVKASFAAKIAAQHEARPDMGRGNLPPYVVCLDGEGGRAMFEAVGNCAVNAIPASFRHSVFDLSGLRLAGDYNKANVVVAATLARAAGVALPVIQRTIPTLAPRWGRLEEIPNANVRARVFVDFAHTPDGLENVLRAVRPLVKGRLWVVFGAGGDRDPFKRPLMGEVCSRLADCVVVTSDNPRSEEPQGIIAEIVKGMSRPPLKTDVDRLSAIAFALREAAEGDVVVIAGKGHETTQEIKGVKHPFDDREVVHDFPQLASSC